MALAICLVVEGDNLDGDGFSDPLSEGDENAHGIKMNHLKFQPFTVCMPRQKCTADLVKLLILFRFFALCFFVHILCYVTGLVMSYCDNFHVDLDYTAPNHHL